MNDDDLELVSAIVARRNPSLADAVSRINTGTITPEQQTGLVHVLGDEIWSLGVDKDGLTGMGTHLRDIIEQVWTVPYFAQQGAVAPVAAPGTDD